MASGKLDKLIFPMVPGDMKSPETFRLGRVFYRWRVALKPRADQPEYTVKLEIVSSTVLDATNCLRPYLEYSFVEWQLSQIKKGGRDTTAKDFAWYLITRIELQLITSTDPAARLVKILNPPIDENIKTFLRIDARNLSAYSRFVLPRTQEDEEDLAKAFKVVASFKLDLAVFHFIFQSYAPYGALITPNTEAAMDKFMEWTANESATAVERSIANGSPFYLQRRDRRAHNQKIDDPNYVDMREQESHATIKYCDIVFGESTAQRQSFFPYEERADAYTDDERRDSSVRKEEGKKTMTLEERRSLILSIHILLPLCQRPTDAGLDAHTRDVLAHHLTACLLSGALGDPASGMWFVLERSDNKYLHRAIRLSLDRLKTTEATNEPAALFSNPDAWRFSYFADIGVTAEMPLGDLLDRVHFVSTSSAFIDGLSPIMMGTFFNSSKPARWPTPTSLYGIDRIIAQTRVTVKMDPNLEPRLEVAIGEPFVSENDNEKKQQQQQRGSWMSVLRRIMALTRADGAPVIVSPLVLAPSVMVKGDKIGPTGSSLFPFYRKEFALIKTQTAITHIWRRYDRSEIISLAFNDFRCKNELDTSQASAMRFINEAFDVVNGLFIEVGVEGGLTRCDWLEWIGTLFDVITSKAAQLRGKKEPEFLLANVLKYVDRLLVPAGDILCHHHYVHRGYETEVFREETMRLHTIMGSIITGLVLFVRTLSNSNAVTDAALEQKLRDGLNLPTLVKAWFGIGVEVETDYIPNLSLTLEASTLHYLTNSMAEKYLYGKPLIALAAMPKAATDLSPNEQKALEAVLLWNATMRQLLNSEGKRSSLQEWFGVTSVNFLSVCEWSSLSAENPLGIFKKRIPKSDMEDSFKGALRGSIYSELSAQMFTAEARFDLRNANLMGVLAQHGNAFDNAISLMLSEKERGDVAPIWYTALPYHPILLGFLMSKARSDLDAITYLKQLQERKSDKLAELVSYLHCVRKSRPNLVTSLWFEGNNEERISGPFLDTLLKDQVQTFRDQVCFYMNPLNRLFVYALQNGRYALQTEILRFIEREEPNIDLPPYQLIPIALKEVFDLTLSPVAPSVHDAILAAWVGGNNVADQVGVYGLMLKRYMPGVLTILAVMQGGRKDARVTLAKHIVDALGQDAVQKWARQYVEPSLPIEALFVDHTFLREGGAPIPISHTINTFLKSLDTAQGGGGNDDDSEIDAMDIDSLPDPSESFELIAVETFKGLTRSRVSLDEMGHVLSWLMQSESQIALNLANPAAYVDREVRASTSLTSRHMAGLILSVAAADDDDPRASEQQAIDALLELEQHENPAAAAALLPKRTETAIRDLLRQGSAEVDNLVLNKSWKMSNLRQQWKKSPFMLLPNETLAALASATFSKSHPHQANDLARFERTYSLWSSSVDTTFKQQVSSIGIVPRPAHTQFLKPRACKTSEEGVDMMEEEEEEAGDFPSTVLVEDSMQLEREASEEEPAPASDPKYVARSATEDRVDVTVVYKSTSDLFQREERSASEEDDRPPGQGIGASSDDEEEFTMVAPGSKPSRPSSFIVKTPARPVPRHPSEASSLDKAKLVGNTRLSPPPPAATAAAGSETNLSDLLQSLKLEKIPAVLAQSKLLLRIAQDRTQAGLMDRTRQASLFLASAIVKPVILMDMMNRVDLFVYGIEAILTTKKEREADPFNIDSFDPLKPLKAYITNVIDPTLEERIQNDEGHVKPSLEDAFNLAKRGSVNLASLYEAAWILLLKKPDVVPPDPAFHTYYRSCFDKFVDAVVEDPNYPYSIPSTYLKTQYRKALASRAFRPHLGDSFFGFDKENPEDWQQTDPKQVVFFEEGDKDVWSDLEPNIRRVRVEDLSERAANVADKDGNVAMIDADEDLDHPHTSIDPDAILNDVKRRSPSRMPAILRAFEKTANEQTGSIPFDTKATAEEWTILSKTVLQQTASAITAFHPQMLRSLFLGNYDILSSLLRFILAKRLPRVSIRIGRWLSEKNSCKSIEAALYGSPYEEFLPKNRGRNEAERMTRALAYILCGVIVRNADGTKMSQPLDVLLDDFETLFFYDASDQRDTEF